MKQKLFTFLSLTALLASCSNEEIVVDEQGALTPESKGIVFSVNAEPESRGDFEYNAASKAFEAMWNAEKDQIAVMYYNAKKGAAGVQEYWNGIAGATTGSSVAEVEIGYDSNFKPAIYKATTTGPRGYFTSNDGNNLLEFDGDKKASFRVYRPFINSGASVKYSTDVNGIATMNVTVNDFTAQAYSNGKPDFSKYFFMASEPIDDVNSQENAVGESLDLKLSKVFAVLAIQTKGYEADIYGKLKTVTVGMTESNIAASAATVDVAKKVNGKWNYDVTTSSKTVKLTLDGSGIEWSDDKYAYIEILPVDRSKMTQGEDYTVTLGFTNGDVELKYNSKNTWAQNGFAIIPCDLTQEPYLYLSTSNKLIINSEISTADLKAKSSAISLVSKVALSKEQLDVIKNDFSGLTSVTLANQAADLGDNLANLPAAGTMTTLTLTEATTAPVITNYADLTTLNLPKVTAVPAGAFKSNTVLTSVSMPLVQTIGDNAFEGATGLTTIGCATGDKIIIGTTKDDVKTSALTSVGANAFKNVTLTAIDAPALTTLSQYAFGATALTTLTEVLLPKYAFDNEANNTVLLSSLGAATVDLSGVQELTTALNIAGGVTTVTLKEGANVGEDVFANCANLATVNNIDKLATIGEGAFSGTAVNNFTLNTETIGKNAFKDCTSLTTLTLGAKVKNIEEGAFSGCTSLATLTNLASVETIGKEAFKGTAITTFGFYNATLGEGAFQNCTAISGQVMSNVVTLEKNVFNGASGITSFSFPKATEIGEGALSSLKNPVTITFNSALTKIAGNAFCTPVAATTEMDGSSAEKAITGTATGYTLNLGNKEGVTIDKDGKILTYKATDGKYYAITFASVK